MKITRAQSLKLIAATAAGAYYATSAKAAPTRLQLIVLNVGDTIIQDHGDVPDALQSAFAKKGHP